MGRYPLGLWSPFMNFSCQRWTCACKGSAVSGISDQFCWLRSAASCSAQFWNRMAESNSNTLRDQMKANSGALSVGLDRWRLPLVICRVALYTKVTFYISYRKLNISNLHMDLRFRHRAVWREAHGKDLCSWLKNSWLKKRSGLSQLGKALCLRDRILMYTHHLFCRNIWMFICAIHEPSASASPSSLFTSTSTSIFLFLLPFVENPFIFAFTMKGFSNASIGL